MHQIVKKRKRIPYVPKIASHTPSAPLPVPVTAAEPAAVTAEGVVQCRFELFVVLRTGVISRFKNQQRQWCYRGDKYTSDEGKMLRNLINHIKKESHNYYLMEMYDNTLPREAGKRLIMKIQDERVVRNRIPAYTDFIARYDMPENLKNPVDL